MANSNDHNGDHYHTTTRRTIGPRRSFRAGGDAMKDSATEPPGAQMPQVAQQHDRLAVPCSASSSSSSSSSFSQELLRNTRRNHDHNHDHHHQPEQQRPHDHHHYQPQQLMTMKPSKHYSTTNNGQGAGRPQTSGCQLIVHPNRCHPKPIRWFPETGRLRLPLLLALVGLLAVAAMAAEQQQVAPTGAVAEQKIAGTDSAMAAPKASAEDQAVAVADASNSAASDVAETSGKLKGSTGETMMIAESRAAQATDAAASQPAPADSSNEATQKQADTSGSRVEPQQQQQQPPEEVAVPTVSGLTNQEEQLVVTTQQTTTGGAQQQFVEADQQQQQQADIVTTSSSTNFQQSVDGTATGSVLEAVRGAAETMNDVLPLTEQFGRKSSSEQQQPNDLAKPSQQQQPAAAGGNSKGKIRSLKRAFSGHMGVFGRKRNQSNANSNQSDQTTTEEQHMGFEPIAAKPGPVHHPRPHHHHYYYQHQDYDTPTAQPLSGGSSSTRTKLKEADFPDYREILIQPDRAEMGFKPISVGSFEAARELARTSSQQQQPAAAAAQVESQLSDQQQSVFEQQGHIQVNENDFTEQPEVRQQQVETTTTTPAFALEANRTNGEPSSGGPFIRLSNIATINSSSADGAPGNGSSNGVKLMRIYVIDLDQKLVVGSNNQQPQQPQQQPDTESGIRFTLPEVAGQASHGGDYNFTTLHSQYGNGSSSSHPQQQQQQHYSEQQATQQAQLPEGYVLLDRDSLRANLSQMFSLKLAPQATNGYNGYNNYSQTNYSQNGHYLQNSARAEQAGQGPPQQQYPQQQQQQQPPPPPQLYQLAPQFQQYQLGADTPPSPAWPAAGYNGSAQLSASPDQYQPQQQQQPTSYSGPRGSNYTTQEAQMSYTGQAQGVYLPANHNHNNVATYSEPVSFQFRHQQVPSPSQVHQSVPQYIAPQYRPTGGGGGQQQSSGKPDNEYAGEWSQPAPQQPQYRPMATVQLSTAPEPSPLPGHPAASPASSAPGAIEQVRYNNNNNNNHHNNYTSKATLFVQAPVSRQQDKHHANASHPNVYHHQQQQQQQAQPGPMMYQQAQPEQPVVILNPTPVYSTQAQSALAAASAYTAAARPSEPAPTSYYKHNNEHKVTTPGEHQSWKPVDYSAPLAAYSQTHQTTSSSNHPQQQQQSSISPAQCTNNNRASINGYRDHDVVSLAASRPAGHQQQQQYYQQQRQVEAPGQVELEGPANVSLAAYDGQHAPLNYQQPRKSYPSANYNTNKQAAYVNTQTDDQQQPSVGSSQQQQQPLDTLSSNDPVYANDGPSQQVLPSSSSHSSSTSTASAHPSFTGAAQTGHQYNGTGRQLGATGHAWPPNEPAQPPQAKDYQQPQYSSGTNEYSSPKGLSKQQQQHSQASSYGQQQQQQKEGEEQEQYGSNPLAAYGSQGQQLTGAKQPLIKFAASSSSADQSFTHEAPKIPQANSSGYRQQQQPHKSAPASAYLAVNGPPIADGVYSSGGGDESSKQGRPNRYRGGSKPAPSGLGRAKPAKGRPGYSNGKQTLESAYSDQQETIYQQHESSNGEQPLPGQQTGDEYGAGGSPHASGPASYYGAPASAHYGSGGGHSRPGNNYLSAYQRPPMVAVANYYRPSPQASKGLLSWETLQSVASGAAKRLPSLSSILMPFSSAIPGLPVKGTLYPTANYAGHQPYHYRYNQQHPPAPPTYPKSVHFDRDVSNFHRPYPLRHMQSQPSNGYQDAPTSSSEQHSSSPKHYQPEAPETSQQQQHSSGEPEAASQDADHQGGEYGADLSLASSNEHSPSSPSATGGAQQQEEPAQEHPEGVDEAVAQELSQSSYTSGGGGGTRHGPMPNISILSMHDDEAGSKQNLDVIEFAPEDASYTLNGKTPTRPRQVKSQPKGGLHTKSAKQATGASKSIGHSTAAAAAADQALDPEQAAVLSSIEQQLSGKPNKRKQQQPPKRAKNIPTLSSASSPDAVATAAAAAAASTDFLEPTILAEHGGPHNAPVPLEALPVDQQRLLMSGSTGGKRPYFGAPQSNIVFPAGGSAAEAADQPMSFGGGGGGAGDGRRPLRPLNSMQIGQFKITPQTQFVQSIIEPSRQMFGQYFQKYIGQLGQTLG